MRLKPIILGSVLLIALGGAVQPLEDPGDTPPSETTPEVSSDAPESPPIVAQDIVEPAAQPTDDAPPGDADQTPAAPEFPGQGEAPTREFMVGVWTEELSKCGSALDFKADGSLIGPFPRWELEGGLLTLVGSRQKIQLKVIDKDTMQSRRSDTDPPRTLKRCPPTQ